jgi:CRISPR-associated protein Csm2
VARQDERHYDFPKPDQQDLETIITKTEGSEVLVRWAEKIGKTLAKQRLTTNQIRAIFGEVRRIEGDWKIEPERANRSLILLKPKMAYRAKREQGRAVEGLVSVLAPAIDLVQGKAENFTRFVDFFEAIWPQRG